MSALSEDHTCAAPTARSIEACPPPSAFDQGLEFDDLTLEAAMDTPSRQETMSPPASITKAAPAGLESLDSGRSVASSKTKEIKRRVGPSDHADNRPDGPPGSSASRLKRQRTAEPGSRTKSKDPRGAVAAAAAVDEDPLYVRRPDTSRAAPAHELPRTLAAPHFAVSQLLRGRRSGLIGRQDQHAGRRLTRLRPRPIPIEQRSSSAPWT